MPRAPEGDPYMRSSREPPARRDDREPRRILDPVSRDRRPERERERDRDRDRDFRMEDAMDTRMDSRMDTRMDTRIDPRMETRMDTRLDPRPDPRLDNRTGVRMETRTEQRPNTGRPLRDGREVVYRDMETGQIYQDPPPGPRRAAYADDFDDLSPPSRPIINAVPTSDGPYNEYFVPGDGIDREVIQREICRYLGPDALCRVGKSADGRSGYFIKAYRALTSEMIKSLQESSGRLYAERDRRRRTGRGGDVTYSEIQDNRDYGYHDHQMSMDMDMDDRSGAMMGMPRMGREDHRPDPRLAMPPRQGGLPPSTDGYMQDPGYGAFTLAHNPNPQHGLQYEPRTAYNTGNTTPPQPGGMRPTHPGFSMPTGFPARTTAAPIPSMTVPAYREPATDRIRDYPYPPDARHRGR